MFLFRIENRVIRYNIKGEHNKSKNIRRTYNKNVHLTAN